MRPYETMSHFLAPLHPDGWKFVGIFALVTVALFIFVPPLGWVGLVLTVWCAYFFRDPWRVTPQRAGLMVSPADGRVLSVAPAVPPAELEMGVAAMTRIGIFLNVFDVHVNRVPVGGRIAKLSYRKGKFVNASLDKASEDNERMAIRIAPGDGAGDVAVVQIAGLIARRIVCDLREREDVVAGQRFGIIRFGSRTDVYLPVGWVPLVIAGQRVVGGETVIADRSAQEAPRQGFAH
jgi:phosphatidylserine decarboxylase